MGDYVNHIITVEGGESCMGQKELYNFTDYVWNNYSTYTLMKSMSVN